jgi:hypothetical protein
MYGCTSKLLWKTFILRLLRIGVPALPLFSINKLNEFKTANQVLMVVIYTY